MAGKWKRRLLKFGGYGAGVLVLLLAVGITVTVGWRPFVGPKSRALTERRFEATPQRLSRGKYLAESVTGCMACHTKLDQNNLPGSYADAKKGGGATMGEGGAAWLVEPVRNPLPKTNIPFPLSRLINTAPEPLSAPVPEPDRSNPVKYGEYLIKVSDCAGCHTPRGGTGQAVEGLEYGAGNVFDDGKGHTVATANITPDPTGISYYDEALFVETIRTGHVKARKLDDAMPWWAFRNMTDEDLKAMFAYLRTLKPASHRVDNTEPPTPC